MFASQVPDYLDDDLLGTDSTRLRPTSIRTTRCMSALANLRLLPRRIRHGAMVRTRIVTRATKPGTACFSRLHREQEREYVVALNNSESEKTAAIPTYVRNGNFVKVYGSGSQELTSNGNRLLTVTVPALSAVVYESAQRIPRSDAAPRDLGSLQSDDLDRDQLTDAGAGQRRRFLLQ